MLFSENEIASEVVDAAYKVHTILGPGLLESVYEAVMVYELNKRGFKVESQLALPVIYESVKLNVGFKVDLLVEGKVIVELKSVDLLSPVHKKQLLTYLRISNKKLGLLINFGSNLIKDGITRIVNGIKD